MFVTLSVAAMVSMAAYSDTALDQVRTAYGNCIIENTISHLGQKTAENDFAEAMKSVCQDEQKAFQAAVIASEKAEGASAKEAAEIAQEEVDMMIEDSVLGYAEHLEGETLPVKEG